MIRRAARRTVPIRIAVGVAALAALSGCATTPRTADRPVKESGVASYYAEALHGRRTASGERYDSQALTAAHRTLPFGTRVRVTNLENGLAVVVRINDRGPNVEKRVIDLSYAAARKLQFLDQGTTRVSLEVLDP
jgi:rare lipoprotein A